MPIGKHWIRNDERKTDLCAIFVLFESRIFELYLNIQKQFSSLRNFKNTKPVNEGGEWGILSSGLLY